MGCVEKAFLSTHWSRCKSRIVEAQGLTTRHIEELNGKKVLNESTQFCGLKGVLCYKSNRYLRGRERKAFDRGVFW